MDKCIACQYYDRGNGHQLDTRGISWGQCRRSAPHLHPVNQKAFMIEGVWPHVRDDDWCGEWKATPARRMESRQADLGVGPLIPIASSNPFGTRPTQAAAVSTLGASANSAVTPGTAASFGAARSSGRGD